MSSNPVLWSSIGFWILMLGLVGDFIALFVPSGRTEKMLAGFFTVLIAVGVGVEHEADKIRFGPRSLSVEHAKAIAESLKPLAMIAEPKGIPERADIIAFPVTNEAIQLAHELNAILNAAEWNSSMGLERGEDLGVTVTGVAAFSMLDSPKSSRCAKALASELNPRGIMANALSGVPPGILPCSDPRIHGNPKTDPSCSRILVIVGDHP